MKTCKRCQQVKPFEDFGKSTYSPGGFERNCKDCCAEKRREYREYEAKLAIQCAERIKAFEGRFFVPETRAEKLARVRDKVLRTYVTPDHEFLLDLHEVLIEAMFLRGRKSPFDHLQFIETGRGWDTFETDL